MTRLRRARLDGTNLAGAGGFALTLTLIIVALAAIVVVAFLTTTSTERTTAAAYGRMTKARQMAEAGVDAGIARLVTEMKYRPYHAIGYRSVANGIDTEIVPVITGPRTTTPASVATYNSAPVAAEDVYLISVSSAAAAGIPGSSAPANFTADNSVDLNANRVASEPKGWIGSPTTAATPIPYRAPWIEVLSDPTKAAQPDPTQANYNPIVGRYAYWIEDESSKLDISSVGNKLAGGAFQRANGVSVTELDIGALPLLSGSPLPASDIATNSAILDLRAQLPMLDARFLNRTAGLAQDVHEATKFYATAFALSNDLAGTGRRRSNVNALVTSPTSAGAAVPPATVAANIDDIGYVITGTHLITRGLGPPGGPRIFGSAPVSPNSLVDFGARFFASPLPTAAQKDIYLERIAANIRDYIDADSQPTIIDTAGPTVRPIGIPNHTIQTSGGTAGTNEVVAIGKEHVPLIQEYGIRVRQVAFSPRTGAFANYTIAIDHYVEFWNMSNRDILLSELGPNPFLLIADQPGWDAGSLDSIPAGAPRDFRLPLNSAVRSGSNTPLVSFPAGVATVITTDPQPLSTPSPTGGVVMTPDLSRVYYIPITPDNGTTGLRTYAGRTDKKSGSELRLNLLPRTTGNTDYETEIVLGNDLGILESAWGAGAISSVISVNVDNETPPVNRLDTSKYHFRGAFLKGNSGAIAPIATTGDPRANSDQIRFDLNGSSAEFDKTRYYNSGLNNNTAGNSSLGAANTLAKPAGDTSNNTPPWPDYSSNSQSINDAPSVVANAAITSIGQLGDVFDPVRAMGDSNDITLSRSGGRTLKIGQPDDLNGVQNAGGRTFGPAWFNSAWRLTDLFAALPVSNPAQPPLSSEVVASPTSRGKININGVVRDGGVAFRAALRGFSFLAAPNSDPQLNGNALPPADVDNLIASIQTYLTSGPMLERGELSQLSFFHTGANVAGQSVGTTNDRGREEIFRRTIEMVTTRSASFTVYTIGEAVRQERAPGGTWRSIPVGQKRLAVTFHLEPQSAGAPLVNSTVPHAVVDSYRVNKIYAPN